MDPTRISVGEVIPPVAVDGVDAEKMKTMAALIDDPNPIHWDVDAVRALGMGERAVNQGPSNLAYVMNALILWTGDATAIRRIRCRFNGNVFAGDHVVAGGRVTSVEATADDRLDVECEVWLERDGHHVLEGTARLALAGGDAS